MIAGALYTLDFVEEPIRDKSLEAYASLRTMNNIPLPSRSLGGSCPTSSAA